MLRLPGPEPSISVPRFLVLEDRMPADAREQIRQLPSGKWQLRYYDRKGVRHSAGAFPSKSAARAHYRDVIEPGLNGKPVARRDLTYTDLVDVFLERHAIVARPRTITELRWRLKQSQAKFGTVPLVRAGGDGRRDRRVRRDAARAAPLPADGGVPAGARSRRPVRLHDPQPREARRARTRCRPHARSGSSPPDEITRSPTNWEPSRRPLCGSRPPPGYEPSEWASVERRDVDKARRVVLVRGTKTIRSRREVPLTTAALDALEQVPPRLDSRYVFTTTRKCPGTGEPGPFDVANFRRRSGGRRSTRPGSRRPRGSTTSGRRSPRTRSPPGSPCSSWRGSWARARR